jgi:hypothetical protein
MSNLLPSDNTVDSYGDGVHDVYDNCPQENWIEITNLVTAAPPVLDSAFFERDNLVIGASQPMVLIELKPLLI